jgi:4-amino-4-deoxy-L-arabinose transferase-like glycosyltransferase
LAYKLFKKWDWNLFLSGYQIPPAHFWGQALFFHVAEPSLSHLWLFPTFLSMGVLGLGYWAARQYFSKTFSFFASCSAF